MLTEQIRSALERSPFVGEGYRKVWARLRMAGVRTAKGRVLRLMREAGLLAPTRVGRRRGPAVHDGTICTDRPDEMWGTDATACLTTREGNATVSWFGPFAFHATQADYFCTVRVSLQPDVVASDKD